MNWCKRVLRSLLGVVEEKDSNITAQLTEYQAAQVHLQTVEAVIWQGMALIIGGSLAAIAFVVTQESSLPVAIGISALGSGIILLIEVWLAVWRRHVRVRMQTQRRMREIERATGMRRNIYLHILARWANHERLEEWQWLAPEERTNLAWNYPVGSRGLPWPGGEFAVDLTARLLQMGIFALMAGKWLEHLL